METELSPAQNIDTYIAGYPPDVQKILQKVRQTIQAAAPQASEAIKYGIPTFTFHGNLVHFAAYKNHLGFYPAPSGLQRFQQELSAYKGSKGAVQFPFDQPIPYDLIAAIVRFRVHENLEMAEAKRKKK